MEFAICIIFTFQLDDVIDLVIPRGSNKLVSQIKSSTKIPVLGHAGKAFLLNMQAMLDFVRFIL